MVVVVIVVAATVIVTIKRDEKEVYDSDSGNKDL
jgi:hypothetical protein